MPPATRCRVPAEPRRRERAFRRARRPRPRARASRISATRSGRTPTGVRRPGSAPRRSRPGRGERRARARPLHRPLHDLGRRGDHDRGARLRGTSAARMGLQAGDQIVKIDGAVVEPEDISRLISGSEGRPAERRRHSSRTGGQLSDRRSDGRGRLSTGVHPAAKGSRCTRRRSESLDLSWRVTRDIGAALGRLVTGEGRDQIASPVGIVQGSSDAAKQGTESFLFVLGLISLDRAPQPPAAAPS